VVLLMAAEAKVAQVKAKAEAIELLVAVEAEAAHTTLSCRVCQIATGLLCLGEHIQQRRLFGFS
jgi:hypothetical protein